MTMIDTAPLVLAITSLDAGERFTLSLALDAERASHASVRPVWTALSGLVGEVTDVELGFADEAATGPLVAALRGCPRVRRRALIWALAEHRDGCAGVLRDVWGRLAALAADVADEEDSMLRAMEHDVLAGLIRPLALEGPGDPHEHARDPDSDTP